MTQACSSRGIIPISHRIQNNIWKDERRSTSSAKQCNGFGRAFASLSTSIMGTSARCPKPPKR